MMAILNYKPRKNVKSFVWYRKKKKNLNKIIKYKQENEELIKKELISS